MARNPSISLTAQQQDFIDALVASGRYHGVSEVVRAGLRLLEEEERRKQAAIEGLRAAVAVADADIADGRVQDFDAARIIAKGRARSGR